MNTIEKTALGVLGTAAGVLAATAGAYLPFVLRESQKNYSDDCAYLMVLGGSVLGADTPSPQLLQRMQTAVRYLGENKTCYAVACGGCFRPGQKKSEAEIIAAYLTRHGIAAERILLEDKSTTTFENFVFAAEVIRAHSGKRTDETRIAFLSSGYHLFRAGRIAQCCGLQNPGKVSAPAPAGAWKWFVREYFAAFELPYRLVKSKLAGRRGKRFGSL